MTYQHIGNGPPPPPAPPPPRASSGNGKLFLGIGIGLFIGLGVGCLGMLGMAANDDKPTTNAAATTTSTYVPQKEQIPATTAPAPPPAPAGPATTIGDGTWTVGVDIAAGTWRPAAPAPDNCYWAVLKSGTNGTDIIANDNGGGRPTVTLKEGQDFQSSRCGTWAKQ